MNILLVEDSTMMQERLSAMISKIDGMKVVGMVDNQADAVRSLSEIKPDMVILDLHLASGNGLEVLRMAKQQGQMPWVIVLTNNCYPQYLKKCMELGARHFLDKSRDIPVLEKILVEATGQAWQQ